MRPHRTTHCVSEILPCGKPVAQIPEIVPKLRQARVYGACGNPYLLACLGIAMSPRGHSGSLDLEHCARKILRKRVVEFRRKRVALAHPRLCGKTRLIRGTEPGEKYVCATAQRKVPNESHKKRREKRERGKSDAPRRPPWRTLDDGKIIRPARNEEESLHARERRVRTPVLGVHHDNAGRFYNAADGKLIQGGTSRIGLNSDKPIRTVKPDGMFSDVRHLCNLAAKTHEATMKVCIYAHDAARTRCNVIRRDSNSFVDNFTLFTFNFTLSPNGARKVDSVEICLRKSRYLHEVTGSWRR